MEERRSKLGKLIDDKARWSRYSIVAFGTSYHVAAYQFPFAFNILCLYGEVTVCDLRNMDDMNLMVLYLSGGCY